MHVATSGSGHVEALPGKGCLLTPPSLPPKTSEVLDPLNQQLETGSHDRKKV
ncbi:hypothetical protein M404DRAFT_1004854 [Pisolithus tinctorius Marx 270]|uniref:Uncharacterized protein n=1 Tax=Pisolithus tinctorius Marx 270 TaxID=870435 RepID=A0A0C3IQE5_PISTI|nr:hypothetical protein M404DRAFT_1004854 [Pisolithus tinctorius Marx 270]